MAGKTAWGLHLAASVLAAFGCGADQELLLPPRDSPSPPAAGWVLVARLAHVTDTHVVDEESPARVAGGHAFTRSAWRPYEAYATQLLDGIVRTVNRIHASGRTINFLVHTGDACDNAQSNELAWFVTVMDGGLLDPRSGPDDRPAETRPEPPLDPHAPFVAQGLYRQGSHGDQPSIPWYTVLGNHDVYSLGVFPIVEDQDGHRTAPLPLDWRPGWVLPVRLDPLGSLAYGNVTPADPGPPCLFETPRTVEPSPSRAFFSKPEFVGTMLATLSTPAGHGAVDTTGTTTWFSVTPVAGVRLIGLDTTDRAPPVPGSICAEGALSRAQLEFLRTELDAAAARDEVVVLATHHPSAALLPLSGSEVDGSELRNVLAGYPQVVLHLAGHVHRNRVTQRDGYLEIKTCATLDWPQEGRLIEIWRDQDGHNVAIVYEMFSHLEDELPSLGPDPLRRLRETALGIAGSESTETWRHRETDAAGADPRGAPLDRSGLIVLTR